MKGGERSWQHTKEDKGILRGAMSQSEANLSCAGSDISLTHASLSPPHYCTRCRWHGETHRIQLCNTMVLNTQISTGYLQRFHFSMKHQRLFFSSELFLLAHVENLLLKSHYAQSSSQKPHCSVCRCSAHSTQRRLISKLQVPLKSLQNAKRVLSPRTADSQSNRILSPASLEPRLRAIGLGERHQESQCHSLPGPVAFLAWPVTPGAVSGYATKKRYINNSLERCIH